MNKAPELEMYREGVQEVWPLDWTNPVSVESGYRAGPVTRLPPYIKLDEDRTSTGRGEQALDVPFTDFKGVAVIDVRVKHGSQQHRRYKELADLWLLLAGNRKEKVLANAEPTYAQKMQSWLCERTGATPTSTLR